MIDKDLIKKILLEYDNDINPKIANFLKRRVMVNSLSDSLIDLDIKVYSFNGFPDYAFTSIMTRKDVESEIFKLLYENEFISDEIYNIRFDHPSEINDEYRSIVRTIRKFLNFIDFN